MIDLLWLLVPAAALSGWYTAGHSIRNRAERPAVQFPDDYIKGLNFLLNEQPDKALEVFMRIDEVDSDTVETHIALGNLFRRRGEVERAIRIHQNLIARDNLHPDHRADALLELAKDYLRAGLLDRAEDLFKEVINIGGQVPQAYKHLREIYEQEKDWQQAIDAAVRWQRECGVSQGEVIAHYHCELADAGMIDSQHGSALRHARQALVHDPDCVRASILLGDLAFAQADYCIAIKFYSDVHRQKPDFIPLVLPKLKEAFARRGDFVGHQKLLRHMRDQHGGLSVTLDVVDSLKQFKGPGADTVLSEEMARPLVSLRMITEFIRLKTGNGPNHEPVLRAIGNALDAHVRRQASHLCYRCGLETRALYWQCPGCHGWGTVKPIDPPGNALKSAPQPAPARQWRASAGK
ncbi:MAG: lipopolysaccharide assembly protein LapB [Gammaproteobacteria bacterium]|nr:lipopolysaccharide assembly protein LapB [Gammaproteobacteria bacterium]